MHVRSAGPALADFRAPAGVRGGRRRDDARRAAGGTARHGATDPEGRQTAATRDRRGEARDEGSGGKRLDSPDGAHGRRRACEETGVSAPLSQAPPDGPRPPRLPAALTPATKTPRPENPRPPSPHPTESARRASTHPSGSRGGLPPAARKPAGLFRRKEEGVATRPAARGCLHLWRGRRAPGPGGWVMAASCAVWLPCRAPRVRRGPAERGGPAVLTRRAQLSRPRGAVAGPDVEGDVPTRDRVS